MLSDVIAWILKMCELCWETYVTSFRGLPHYQCGLIILLEHKSIMAAVNCDTLNATSNALQATHYILGCIDMLIYIRGMDPCWKKVKKGFSQFRNSGTLNDINKPPSFTIKNPMAESLNIQTTAYINQNDFYWALTLVKVVIHQSIHSSYLILRAFWRTSCNFLAF